MGTIWRMIRCGRCKRCLAGGRVHGPYPHHYEGGKHARRHLYGEGSDGAVLSPAEEGRMQAEAEAEYEDLKRSLTPEQTRKLDNVMGRIAVLRKAERARERETKKRTDEAREKGLSRRAMEHIGREIAEQFAAELAELKRQVAKEKKELKRMLKEGGGR